MSRVYQWVCTSLCACSAITAFADAPPSEQMPDAFAETLFEFPKAERSFVTTAEPPLSYAKEEKHAKASTTPFTAFTGKVKGNKVRMRLLADLDSRVIKELRKHELVSIVGEYGDFWAVTPPSDIKGYVFRSFILDNVVEGNRVNVRLEPNLEAPVIAHLNAGERLEHALISPQNHKWLEITPPPQTHFYVAKEYVDYAGGPELKTEMDRRLTTAQQMLDATAILSQAELKKTFEEIDFDRIVNGYRTVMNNYPEFSELTEHAKEGLTAFQESYLAKRIAYLESRPLLAQSTTPTQSHQTIIEELGGALSQITDKMRMWEPIEEALYASWSNINESKNKIDFYDQQRLLAVTLSGIVEPYNSPVKNKPGNFILRENETPVGYLYSTQINLQSLVGRKVHVLAAPRPNNNFAFPAYFVLAVE